MTKPGIAMLAGAALALLTGGCGGSGATHRPPTAARLVSPTANDSTAQSPGSQQGAHAFASSPLTPVSPTARAASPPAVVLRRYALLYGNLCSCSRAAANLSDSRRWRHPV